MAQYTKKPVVIDAWQLDSGFEHPLWLTTAIADGVVTLVEDVETTATVQTLEGVMTAQPHSYLIRGPYGEIYPCRADIFLNTYDPMVTL